MLWIRNRKLPLQLYRTFDLYYIFWCILHFDGSSPWSADYLLLVIAGTSGNGWKLNLNRNTGEVCAGKLNTSPNLTNIIFTTYCTDYNLVLLYTTVLSIDLMGTEIFPVVHAIDLNWRHFRILKEPLLWQILCRILTGQARLSWACQPCLWKGAHHVSGQTSEIRTERCRFLIHFFALLILTFLGILETV